MDALTRVRQRIKQALATRADLTLREFAEQIGQPSASWRSEVLKHEAKSWPDRLTLTVRAARVLGVSVGYLLGERDVAADAQTDQLQQVWEQLTSAERTAALSMLRGFLIARGTDPTRAAPATTPPGAPEAGPRTPVPPAGVRPKKRR